MQKIFFLIGFIFSASFLNAQTFTGTGGAIPPGPNNNFTCFSTAVTGVGNINDVSNGLASICINVNHPDLEDLEIILRAPDGTTVPLTIQNGGTGNNYTNTCFTATAATSVKFGTAPFSGSFIPEGYLGAVNNGQNADAAWNLCIADRRDGASSGTLVSWSISFNNTPAPQPPAFPACANTLPATSSCATATAVCDFNGLCGSTSVNNSTTWPGSGLGSCFGLQNISFIQFVASAATATFTVWVPTNTGGATGGIQMLFFSGNCGSGAVTTHGCYPHIFPYQSSIPLATVITATGLAPGGTYYLMFDGYNNDISTFRIAANSGVNFLNVTPANPAVCEGRSINMTATGSDGPYTWTPALGLNITTGPVVTASPAATSTYTVSTTTSSGCNLTKEVTVTVNAPPVITTHPSTDTQRVCQNVVVPAFNVAATPGSGTISNYQWYITTLPNNTGGAMIPFATSATYTPSTSSTGTLYFYCRVTNSNGCTDTSNISAPLIISPSVNTPTASATVQPTCLSPAGTIVVTAPAGANIRYSIGGVYQASGTFTGLSPDSSYSVTAQNIVTGCISNIRLVPVNALPAGPATPVASVTVQPTCLAPTGAIVVSSPIGATIEYSIGGVYQSGTSFSGLTNGTTYKITAKDIITGCVSDSFSLAINTIPGAPAIPTASVTTQPDCNTTTGIITVTAPVGANIEYSVGGAYQAGGAFSGLTPNTNYSVTAIDNVSGCVSAPLSLAVNAIPTAPATPTASVTAQPNCTIQTGTITVTAPVGASIQYNIGSAYQASGVFAGLTPGTSYSVTAIDNVSGCVSAALPLLINAIPVAPAMPAASITTQPSCNTPTGIITVTAPVGISIEYSNGGAYQPGNTFTGLTPGTAYSITAKDNISGCISASLPLTINTISVPASPTASITVQPTCTVPSGTITVTGPVGASIVYSIGGTYQPSGAFAGLTPATTYSITAKDNPSGCISAPLNLTVNAIPAPPAIPTASVSAQPNCIVPTGTITVTAPVGASISYSIGGVYQSGGIFSGLIPGTTYSITAKDNLSGCVSAPWTLAVNAIPAAPAAPTASVTTQPSCTIQTGIITVTAPVGANIEYSVGGAYQAGGTFSGLTPGVMYSVKAKDNLSGCISSPLSLTIGNVPVSPAAPTVNSPVTYCQNNPAVALTATGSNLLWYDNLTNVTPLAGTPTPSTTTPGNTFYYVSQTVNGCESPRRAITVTVNAVSTAVSGFRYNPDTVCINSNNPGPVYDLGFTIGGTFTSIPGGLNINANTGSINLASTTVGSYTVTYSYNTTGCVTGSSASAPITILPAVPTITVFSYTSPVCKNEPDPGPNKRAGFTEGGSYSAGLGLVVNSATGVIDVANSAPGAYQVTYNIPALGCRLATSNFSFITIIDTTTPVTLFNYSPANVCISSAVNPGLVRPADFTPGGTFSATPAGLSINSTTGNINIGLSVPGVYTITYTVPSFICRLAGSYTSTFTITAYANPITGFSYVGPVCKGDGTAVPVQVTGFFNGGLYSSTSGLAIDTASGIINLTQSIAGNYVIKYDVAQGVCNPAGSGTAAITILTQPMPPTVSSASICGPGIVTLSAAAIGTVSWYTEPELLNQINVGNTYTTLLNNSTPFYITNTVGSCESEATVLNATVSPIPAAPFLGNDTAICSSDKLILNASGPYTGYLWQDGTTQPTINVSTSGTYQVIVSTGTGCETSSSILINVLDNCDDVHFPTGFSPNGDGLNDKFGPLGNLFLLKNYTLKIFNRYGEIVFTSNNPYEKWDGSFRGKQNGTLNYVWVAAYIYNNRATKTQKGNLTIVQ